jgi:crotonobetainyl-CoA:carnitine CoA-transferase CaiB-like acyl-CoA transferase
MTAGAERRGPLSGPRILDLTRVLAGPFCTMILGDLGAEVIKVEDLESGDQTRRIPPHVHGESHYFLAINGNKKSLALDARTENGRTVLLDLVRHCDVVVENFRPGVMERLGLGEAALRSANPHLIICSISGYGQGTSLSNKPSFDLAVEALSGAMSVNGKADGPPTKLGLPMGDLGGAVWAAIGILSAVQHRHATGEALTIDLSLQDGLVGMLGYLSELYLLTGESPTRVGSAHQSVVPYGRFPAKHGHLVLALMVENCWVKFCAAIGRPDLAQDERFATPGARKENRQALEAIVADMLCARTMAEWQELFDASDIPCAPVNTIAQAMQMPVLVERGMVRNIDHPTAGALPVVGSPLRFVGQFHETAIDPPPLLGQHTGEILTDLLPYSPEQVEALRMQALSPGWPRDLTLEPNGMTPDI